MTKKREEIVKTEDNIESNQHNSKTNNILNKIDEYKGIILSIAVILGLSFGFHEWMSKYFVPKAYFDNSVSELKGELDTVKKQLEKKLDDDIGNKLDQQFLVLRKNIKETEYSVLGQQLASIHIENKFKLSPFELDNITKMVRKHCMIGKDLGYVPKSSDCEEKVELKLNGGF